MKPFLAAISTTGLLIGCLGIGTARALPRADVALSATPVPVAKVRLVCNDRRCWHTGHDRRTWYRPYGYYRPYRWGPHVGIGSDPFAFGAY